VLFSSVHTALDPARDQAKDFLQGKGLTPKVFTLANLRTFFGALPDVLKLIAQNPEILVFAATQWIVIWLAYLAWTRLLHWIPDPVWDAVSEASREGRKSEFTLLGLVLLAWSFLVVCVASYPIGLCNAAMVAVHDLRTTGKQVTLARCLLVAARHQYRIWLFTMVDSWITVRTILSRLPKKNYRHTALDELAYYAWKVSTMAVVPALVNGRSLVAAGRDSYQLLTAHPMRALGLRLGYSAVCWLVGVSTCAGTLAMLARSNFAAHVNHLYDFYVLLALPVCLAAGAVSVLVRPFFLLGVARFYTDCIDVKAEIDADVAAEPHWAETVLSWRQAVFLVPLAVMVGVVLFGDALGIADWIRRLTDHDLVSYYLHRT
jgi:hypothetical protein